MSVSPRSKLPREPPLALIRREGIDLGGRDHAGPQSLARGGHPDGLGPQVRGGVAGFSSVTRPPGTATRFPAIPFASGQAPVKIAAWPGAVLAGSDAERAVGRRALRAQRGQPRHQAARHRVRDHGGPRAVEAQEDRLRLVPGRREGGRTRRAAAVRPPARPSARASRRRRGGGQPGPHRGSLPLVHPGVVGVVVAVVHRRVREIRRPATLVRGEGLSERSNDSERTSKAWDRVAHGRAGRPAPSPARSGAGSGRSGSLSQPCAGRSGR